MSKSPDLLRGKSIGADGKRKRLVPSLPVALDYETDLTQQQFKDECDLSLVVRNWLKTGDPTLAGNIRRGTPQFVDVSAFTDLRDALASVQAADDLFAQLPSEARRILADNPQNLVDAYLNGDVDLLRSCGLLPEAPKSPAPAEPRGEAPAPSGAQGTGA